MATQLDPFVKFVGQICRKCCDCSSIDPNGTNPDLKCCNSLEGVKPECYDPKDSCRECIDVSPAPAPNSNEPKQKLVPKCKEQSLKFVHENKNKCCDGECYDNCSECIEKKVQLRFDNSRPPAKKASKTDPDKIYICCGGTTISAPKREADCYECKDTQEKYILKDGREVTYTKSVPELTDPPPGRASCCYGEWYDPDSTCDTCDDNAKKLIKLTCNPPEFATNIWDHTLNRECCNGECYNPTCYDCIKTEAGTSTITPKPDCKCCINYSYPIGSQCCKGGQLCCVGSSSEPSECYDPNCDVCT